MTLSYFMRNFFSEKLAYNHVPISVPPFWHVKCLLSIHPHSFLQFPLLWLGSSFSLPSPILIFLWNLPVPFTKFCLHLSQWPQKALDSDSHMIVSGFCLYNINNFEIVSKGLLYSQGLNSFKRCFNLKKVYWYLSVWNIIIPNNMGEKHCHSSVSWKMKVWNIEKKERIVIISAFNA